MKKLIHTVTLVGLLGLSGEIIAAPWIDANDLFLRSDIQTLADAGIITAPVTTFPLMWSAINHDLIGAKEQQLTPLIANAYQRVMHYYRRAVANNYNHQLKIALASDSKRLSDYGSARREKGLLQYSSEKMGESWAGKLSVQIRDGINDDSSITFDNSYLAATYGNWVVRAGAVSQWWGPGWDTSLIMSNNARPLPALSLSRSNSQAFTTPWLSWIGPWTFIAQMAKLESNRAIPDARLWSTRATARPLSKLEIGLSWSIQWGGNGQPNSLKDFLNAATARPQCVNGASSCDSSMHTKYGNQLAGYDIRWSDTLWDIPFSFYAQTIGEDAVNSIKPTDKAYVFGGDTIIWWQQQPLRLFVEYTTTEVGCGTSDTVLNCYYEHSDYHSGYRYHRRALGATYDNDAVAWTFGIMSQTTTGHSWNAKLRIASLNSDNKDRYPNNPQLGNPVSKISEDLIQLNINYQLPLYQGRLSLSGEIGRSSYIAVATDNSFELAASWDYRF